MEPIESIFSEAEEYTHELTAACEERLDVFCARASGVSRARIQSLIVAGAVFVDGIPCKANTRLKVGQRVTIQIDPPAVLDVPPENIPIDIVYQDADICIINKPQGMVVHPAPGNESGTLVNALLFAINDLSGIGGILRPGIVHRIDKMTSGLLVVAKNDFAHAKLSADIKSHDIRREYLAIVDGNIREDSGVIDAPVGRHPVDRKRMAVVPNGRQAVTHWRVLCRMVQYTLVKATLETGRTHQIRVHMRHIQHPVTGDTVYGNAKPKLGLTGQALHAFRLTLPHPRTGEEMVFYAPPPEYFIAALQHAGWDGSEAWML